MAIRFGYTLLHVSLSRLIVSDVPRRLPTWAPIEFYAAFEANGAPDHVAQDYKDAIAALKDVARGLVSLPVAEGEQGPAQQTGVVMAEHPPQVFTRQKMRGW